MEYLKTILDAFFYRASVNLSFVEALFLFVLALITLYTVWRFKAVNILLAYSIFLILYITLLRRMSTYTEYIRWCLVLSPRIMVWSGHLWNMVLYIPFGWAVSRKMKHKATGKGKIALFGTGLSVLCETVQYLTRRGWFDVNDILFNTLGTIIGIWLQQFNIFHREK